jgi:hypothetical protein
MDMKNEAGFWLDIYWVQQGLIQAYEDNCTRRPVRIGRQSMKWTV